MNTTKTQQRQKQQTLENININVNHINMDYSFGNATISNAAGIGCDEINDGDTGMMMMATTFVMLQTPALGINQAGSIRRKNVCL